MKSIKSIVLDTTYVLPLFGIEVKGLITYIDEIKQFWTKGLKDYKIYLPTTCLIETMFKLLSEYKKNQEFTILDRYQLILPTVLNSPITIFNPELNPSISAIATKIRQFGHQDFMNCWIVGTAVVLKCFFLTEDIELGKILKNLPETKDLILWSWKKFRSEISI